MSETLEKAVVCGQQVIKVDVKVAGNVEFMRCSSGKRKKKIKFINENRKRFRVGERRRRR